MFVSLADSSVIVDCKLKFNFGIDTDVNFTLFHIDAGVGQRIRRRTIAKREKSDAETAVRNNSSPVLYIIFFFF